MIPQITIEYLPVAWFIAFTLDVIIGVWLFMVVIKRKHRVGFDGVIWWMAWWAIADAIALVFNVTLGLDNPFSYHQIGIFTESMLNLGVCYYLFKFYQVVKAMTPEDWTKVDIISAQSKVTFFNNQIKELKEKLPNEP